jgi:hypothetical protein
MSSLLCSTFARLKEKVIFLFGLYFRCTVNNSKKPKLLLGFKTKEKNLPKQESLIFLETTVRGGGGGRKPGKSQGEIQGSRKPSVLVGFLRQKLGLCIHPLRAQIY